LLTPRHGHCFFRRFSPATPSADKAALHAIRRCFLRRHAAAVSTPLRFRAAGLRHYAIRFAAPPFNSHAMACWRRWWARCFLLPLAIDSPLFLH
jgi:hypothetical protein